MRTFHVVVLWWMCLVLSGCDGRVFPSIAFEITARDSGTQLSDVAAVVERHAFADGFNRTGPGGHEVITGNVTTVEYTKGRGRAITVGLRNSHAIMIRISERNGLSNETKALAERIRADLVQVWDVRVVR